MQTLVLDIYGTPRLGPYQMYNGPLSLPEITGWSQHLTRRLWFGI